MQGILANGPLDMHNTMGSPHVAAWAIEYADALLSELDRTAPKEDASVKESLSVPDPSFFDLR